MSQKSSLLQLTRSVSRSLTPDILIIGVNKFGGHSIEHDAPVRDPVVGSWPDGKLCVLYLGVDHHIHALRVSDDGTSSRS